MTQASGTSLEGTKVPFDRPIQSGVEQPGQAHLRLVAFDLKDGVDAADLKELFFSLTDVTRRLTQDRDIEGYLEPEMVIAATNLIITVGFGERIFDILGKPGCEPAGLHDIPAPQHDMLRLEWDQSDFALQLYGDDLATVTTAFRLLEKKAAPWANVKWFQKGFSYAWGSQSHGATPHNPLGQLDDTVNPSTPDEWSKRVWIGSKDKAINNSCVMVARRIALDLNDWDELSTDEHSIVIGRDFHTGAPLSGGDNEFGEGDIDAVDDQGEYLICHQSHLALSREQDGQPDDTLRHRACAYEDQLGESAFPFEGPNAGLAWIAFQKNLDNQLSTIRTRLDRGDLLNGWNRHIGSAVYWIAPDTTPDSYWGQELIEG